MTEKNLEDFLPKKDNSYFKRNINSVFSKRIEKEQIVLELQKVMDPEIPVNLYDLGLIYNIKIDDLNNISIEMTLTNPNCPVAGEMPKNVGLAVENIPNYASINVSLVWHPKWTKELMSEDAKLALDVF